MSDAARARLRALQAVLQATVADCGEADARTQFDPALSPLGWHLRHCAFVEALWIRERVLGDDRLTAPLAEDCLPERVPKEARGESLPGHQALLDWTATTMADNLELLGDAERRRERHGLLANGYLWDFLIGHHAQHLETMRMVRAARAAAGAGGGTTGGALRAAVPDWEWRRLPAGRYEIGTEDGFGFDNEGTAQMVALAGVLIAATPVSNAQYLAFIEDGGYDEKRRWSAAGWRWRTSSGVTCPHGWRRGAAGGWLEVGPDGAQALTPGAAVVGLGRHEAGAFAAWAGATLPHEYQWEAAARLGLLERTGEAWEWCANAFHPYPGFRAHPYREYSAPWFDGRHGVLRGGSRYSEPEMRRPGFRNYYEPACRHVFAGLRLARPA